MTPNNPDIKGFAKLPSVDAKNKLVLLAVNPYMLHSYWELAAIPEGSDGWAVLRLYEVSPAGEESRPTDVEVSLAARNWYLHLWSTDKICYAELGLRREDGSFEAFARSNEIRVPAAGPQGHARTHEIVSRISVESEPEYLTTRVLPQDAPAAAPIVLSGAARVLEPISEPVVAKVQEPILLSSDAPLVAKIGDPIMRSVTTTVVTSTAAPVVPTVTKAVVISTAAPMLVAEVSEPAAIAPAVTVAEAVAASDISPAAAPTLVADVSEPAPITPAATVDESVVASDIAPAAAPIETPPAAPVVIEVVTPEPELAAMPIAVPVQSSIDASAILQQYLTELFAIRGELAPIDETLKEPQEVIPSIPFELERLEAVDLTQYSEERFAPGISSPVSSTDGRFAE